MIRATVSAVLLAVTTTMAAQAREPIPAEAFAQLPAIQSVSMSSDGKNLVALVPSPTGNGEDTALATWNLDTPDAPPVVTPSADRMKFIAASAMKADHLLVVAR